MNPLEMFPGKNTYVVAIGGILAAVAAWFNGVMPVGDMVEAIWIAIAAMTLRKGIKGSK